MPALKEWRSEVSSELASGSRFLPSERGMAARGRARTLGFANVLAGTLQKVSAHTLMHQ